MQPLWRDHPPSPPYEIAHHVSWTEFSSLSNTKSETCSLLQYLLSAGNQKLLPTCIIPRLISWILRYAVFKAYWKCVENWFLSWIKFQNVNSQIVETRSAITREKLPVPVWLKPVWLVHHVSSSPERDWVNFRTRLIIITYVCIMFV